MSVAEHSLLTAESENSQIDSATDLVEALCVELQRMTEICPPSLSSGADGARKTALSDALNVLSHARDGDVCPEGQEGIRDQIQCLFSLSEAAIERNESKKWMPSANGHRSASETIRERIQDAIERGYFGNALQISRARETI